MNVDERTVTCGGQGEVVFDPHHARAEARMAARILSLGVISEEQAAQLLRGAAKLAANAVNQNRPRDYAAAMKVILAAAKLELENAYVERLGNLEQRREVKPEPPLSLEQQRDALLGLLRMLKERRALTEQGCQLAGQRIG